MPAACPRVRAWLALVLITPRQWREGGVRLFSSTSRSSGPSGGNARWGGGEGGGADHDFMPLTDTTRNLERPPGSAATLPSLEADTRFGTGFSSPLFGTFVAGI